MGNIGCGPVSANRGLTVRSLVSAWTTRPKRALSRSRRHSGGYFFLIGEWQPELRKQQKLPAKYPCWEERDFMTVRNVTMRMPQQVRWVFYSCRKLSPNVDEKCGSKEKRDYEKNLALTVGCGAPAAGYLESNRCWWGKLFSDQYWHKMRMSWIWILPWQCVYCSIHFYIQAK